MRRRDVCLVAHIDQAKILDDQIDAHAVAAAASENESGKTQADEIKAAVN